MIASISISVALGHILESRHVDGQPHTLAKRHVLNMHAQNADIGLRTVVIQQLR